MLETAKKALSKGDIAEIAIFDMVCGKVQILKNDTVGRTITYKWLENPTTCYDNQLWCGGETDTVPYFDIASVRMIKEAA